jgi:hypothetical protein
MSLSTLVNNKPEIKLDLLILLIKIMDIYKIPKMSFQK